MANRGVDGTVIHKILPLLTVVLIIESKTEHKMDFTLRRKSNTEKFQIYCAYTDTCNEEKNM